MGMAGNIIGTVTLPSGVSIYVVEIQHNGRSLYLFVEKGGVVR